MHQNPKIRSRFEANLKEKCPMECEKKYWKADVISAEVEEKVTQRVSIKHPILLLRLPTCLVQTPRKYP